MYVYVSISVCMSYVCMYVCIQACVFLTWAMLKKNVCIGEFEVFGSWGRPRGGNVLEEIQNGQH